MADSKTTIVPLRYKPDPNAAIVDRVKGLPSHSATPESDTDPRNPTTAPPREPTERMIAAIHAIHRPGWNVAWRTVWVTMYDAWANDQTRGGDLPDA